MMASCLSELVDGSLSTLAGAPRSESPPDVLGGGISLESRPVSTPRVLFEESLSRFSRAESAVHLGGGSGRRRSRSFLALRSDKLNASLGFRSMFRRSLPEKSRGLSPGLSPSLPLGLSKPLTSGNRESLPSLRSPWRGGCLSNRSRLGNDGSGLDGRLGAGRSTNGALDGSGRGGMFISLCGEEALAALLRLKFSLSFSTSDFLDSGTDAAGGVDLASAFEAAVAFAIDAGTAVFASSTSPSSTSVVVNGLGVTPREL